MNPKPATSITQVSGCGTPGTGGVGSGSPPPPLPPPPPPPPGKPPPPPPKPDDPEGVKPVSASVGMSTMGDSSAVPTGPTVGHSVICAVCTRLCVAFCTLGLLAGRDLLTAGFAC
ncbi:MAG: hypothetical protein DI568_01795 [Sphingomonas sp.]|nr:MAG: hypothetical protein DI568_01795 [Sphingomonas sp.]